MAGVQDAHCSILDPKYAWKIKYADLMNPNTSLSQSIARNFDSIPNVCIPFISQVPDITSFVVKSSEDLFEDILPCKKRLFNLQTAIIM